MKKTFLLITAAVVALASCTKTTNNTTTTNKTTIDTLVTGSAAPAFTVNGIHDISFVNFGITNIAIPITVQYSDSAQETVKLSLSGLPAGITMDTTWTTSGIPTYTTTLTLNDTTQAGAALGTFPMTLTATGAITGTKTYPFNIKITPQPPCIADLMGKYFDCQNTCSGSIYTDSVYADANVNNKMWFTNFGGLGIKLYAMYNCNTDAITLPSQTVGGVTYSGTGEGYYSGSKTIFIELTGGSGFCEIEMN